MYAFNLNQFLNVALFSPLYDIDRTSNNVTASSRNVNTNQAINRLHVSNILRIPCALVTTITFAYAQLRRSDVT